MSEALHLDHTGHVVADLNAASRLYTRLGFDLQPVSHHQTPGPDGRMVLGGTSNQCAMLEQGYLEIVTVTDRDAPSYSARENDSFLRRFQGLHLLAMGTRDAAATRRRLELAGVAFTTRDLGRDVDAPSGPAEARFRLMPVTALGNANHVFFFIEHATRDLVWPNGSTVHRNGAKRLKELVIVTDNPADVVGPLDAAFGRSAAIEADALVWALDHSRLIVATPLAAETHFGVPLAPRDGPYAAGQAVEVDDLAATERLLSDNDIRFVRHKGRLTVAQEDCLGAAMQFCEAAP